MSKNQLPELIELADLARMSLERGNENIDLNAGDLLIDHLCQKIYGGHLYRNDGWETEILRRSGPTVVTRSMLPLPPDSDLRYITSVLQKTTLYSELTVLVCPYSVRYFARVDYSDGGGAPDQAVAEILRANAPFHSLLKGGRCVFLPQYYRSEIMRTIATEVTEYSAPMLQSSSDIGLLPLNTSIYTPTLQRDLFLLNNIVLPYFTSIDLDLVAEVAAKETDSFVRFTHYLASQIAAIGAAPDAKDFERIVAEIRSETAALRIEAKKLASMRIFRGAEVASFVISIIAVLFSDIEILKSLATVVGTTTLLQLIRDYLDSKKTTLDLKKSQFYIPYILNNNRSVCLQVDVSEQPRSVA
jgi:hypothetical protein